MKYSKLASILILIFFAGKANAQDVKKLIIGTAKDVALDPTTYVPAGLNFTARKLDWDSSQIFFRNGFVEYNEEFTVTGKTGDPPISPAQGNRKLIRQAIPVLVSSVINNTSVSIAQRLLVRHYPDHKKLIKIIGWTEKIAVASYLSYKFSHISFSQLQNNKRLARELDLK